METTSSQIVGQNLLLVDDDPAQVRLFQLSLEFLGLRHNFYSACTGTEALAFLYRTAPFESAPRPQLIIMDLNLPGMSGCEVLQQLKKEPQFRSIPVIMFSHSNRHEDVASCYAAQANAYIQKPATLSSNLEIIEGLHQFWFNTVTLPA